MRLQSFFILLFTATMLPAAGACAPKGENRPALDRRGPTDKDAGRGDNVVQLTASYQRKPVDVLLYMNGQSGNQTVRDRIARAAAGFAARFRFVTEDYRL